VNLKLDGLYKFEYAKTYLQSKLINCMFYLAICQERVNIKN